MIKQTETECKSPQGNIKRSDLSEISLRVAKEMPNSEIKDRELRRLDELAVSHYCTVDNSDWKWYECQGCAACCIVRKRLSPPDLCILTGTSKGFQHWEEITEDFDEILFRDSHTIRESTSKKEEGCYTITVILRHLPGHSEPFITHIHALENEGYQGGHYFVALKDAVKDYYERCEEEGVNPDPPTY